VGVAKVEFYIDNIKVGEDKTVPYEYSWNTDVLQYNSQHIIKAKAYDNAGNIGESPAVTVTIGDTQAPQVTITNPQNGQTVSGTVLIQVSVVDKSSGKKIAKAPSGINKVEFYIDGVKVDEDTSFPYEYSWNTTNYSDGYHTIMVKAFDIAGNSSSTSINVNLDNTPPQIYIINPHNEDTVSGIVTIQAQASDNVGVSKVEFYIYNTKVGEDTTSPYEYSWNTTKYSRGTYIVTAKAYDIAGNSFSAGIIVNVYNNIWQKTFGGSNEDYAYSIQQTSDGGYIVAGYTASFGAGGYDVYILKLDSDGNLIWQKTFGGSGYDWAYSIQQTSDGGYIVAGWTWSFGEGGKDIYILKLNENGQLVWQKTFGGCSDDVAHSIQQTSDGGYIISGEKDNTDRCIPYKYGAIFFYAGYIYIIKLDENGNLVWEKKFDGNYGEAYSIQQTNDGGYIVTGEIINQNENADNIFEALNRNICILKLDADGNLVWQKTFGGSSWDFAYSIQQTSDGGYIVAGGTMSFGAGGYDVYILKLDSKGDLVWQKTFGGCSDDVAYSIQQTNDGGYIVAGYTASFGAGGYDVYILKLDADGNLVWEKTFGGSSGDWANSIQQTNDGGYIVAGYTQSFGAGYYDVYILKLDENGNTGPYPQ